MLEQRGLSSSRSHGPVVEWLLAEQYDLGLIPAVLVFSLLGIKLVGKNLELANLKLLCVSPLRELNCPKCAAWSDDSL